jgi:hypothetical protein
MLNVRLPEIEGLLQRLGIIFVFIWTGTRGLVEILKYKNNCDISSGQKYWLLGANEG